MQFHCKWDQYLFSEIPDFVSHMMTHAPVNGSVPGTTSENNNDLIGLFLGVIKELSLFFATECQKWSIVKKASAITTNWSQDVLTAQRERLLTFVNNHL